MGKVGKVALLSEHAGNRVGFYLHVKVTPFVVAKTVKKIKFYLPTQENLPKKKFRVDFRHWRPNIPIFNIGIWGNLNGCP